MTLAGALAVLILVGRGLEPPPEAAPPRADSTQPAALPNADLERALAEFDTRVADVSDLRAEFEQRKHTPLLKQPLVSTGSVLVKGKRVRWDTRSPRPSIMTIVEGTISIYYPEARLLEIYETRDELREFTGSPLPRLDVLRRHFVINRIEADQLGADPADERLLALDLQPTDDGLKQHVSSVRVLLDRAVPCVRKIVMTDPDDERTEIEFKSVRINEGIDDALLELEVPGGTRVSRFGGDSPGEEGPK